MLWGEISVRNLVEDKMDEGWLEVVKKGGADELCAMGFAIKFFLKQTMTQDTEDFFFGSTYNFLHTMDTSYHHFCEINVH